MYLKKRKVTSGSSDYTDTLIDDLYTSLETLTASLNTFNYEVNNHTIVDTTTEVFMGVQNGEDLRIVHLNSKTTTNANNVTTDNKSKLYTSANPAVAAQYNAINAPQSSYSSGSELLLYYYTQGYRYVKIPAFSGETMYSMKTVSVTGGSYVDADFRRFHDGVRPLLDAGESYELYIYKPLSTDTYGKDLYQRLEEALDAVENFGEFQSNGALRFSANVEIPSHKLTVYDMRVVSDLIIPTTEPTNPAAGSIWFDLSAGSNGVLKVYHNTYGWVSCKMA